MTDDGLQRAIERMPLDVLRPMAQQAIKRGQLPRPSGHDENDEPV